MVRAIPSKFFPKLLSGGGVASPAPPSTTSGVLDKTINGYLTREGVDVSGISYTSNFSVEVAIDYRYGDHVGYYGEIIRHGQDANTFNYARPGWSLNAATSGFNTPAGQMTLGFFFSDGGSKQLSVYPPAFEGRVHYAFTYNATSKTLKCYVNGVYHSQSVDATFSPPASIAHPLAIGSMNNTASSYAPGDETFFASWGTKGATPAFKMYLARIWQKELSAGEVTDLYGYWNGKGRIDIPGTVTGTPVTGYNFKDQVGDKNGTPGTGWLKDNYGANHLKFINTNTQTGGSGAGPSLIVPSGAVRITNVSHAATGVSGAIVLQADGLSGSGNAQQYWIEVDDINTFDGPALKQSGWLLADGKWAPRLKPGTVYYARVKGRSGDTLAESSWSSTITFSTRAVTEWFTRPLVNSGTALYGTQSGVDYANAKNGLRWNGIQGGISVVSVEGQMNGNDVAPGDTIWHCGYMGPLDTSNFGSVPWTTDSRYQALIGDGIPNYPITLAFDHATYPGGVIALRRPTGSYGWVNQGGGVFSTTVSIDSGLSLLLFDETNTGFPTLGNPIQNKSYYPQASGPLTSAGWYRSGGTTYVRLPDDSNPGNRLYFARGESEHISLTLQGTYQKIRGGQFIGYPVKFNKDRTTFSAVDIRYLPNERGISCLGKHYLTVEDSHIAWAQSGIYFLSVGGATCGDYCTIQRNWIHNFGAHTLYRDGDSHCIGYQSGSYGTIVDNLCEISGPSIELWSGTGTQSYNLIARNVCRKAYQATKPDGEGGGAGNPFAAGLLLSNGTHDLNTRLGNQILHNVSLDHQGNGFHDSCSDAKEFKYNLLLKTGQAGGSYPHGLSGSPGGARGQSIDSQYNVIVDPNSRFISGGGDGTGTVTMDYNLYWDPVDTASTANKFYFPGVNSGAQMSFNTWKTFKDANSYFENPLTSAHVPAGFDDLMIKGFCRSTLCDFDGDGDVDSADLTYFDAYAPGNGARIAARKLLSNILTYGAY